MNRKKRGASASGNKDGSDNLREDLKLQQIFLCAVGHRTLAMLVVPERIGPLKFCSIAQSKRFFLVSEKRNAKVIQARR